MEIKYFVQESSHQMCQGVQEEKVLSIDSDSSTHDEKLNASDGVDLRITKGVVDKENSTKTDNTHRISFSVPFYPKSLKAEKKNKYV
jgi:hypothetical protein